MSFKVIDTPNDGSYVSETLTIFTEVLSELAGTSVTNALAVSGNTYTLTYNIDGRVATFTSTAGSVEEFLKNTLKTLLSASIVAQTPII